MNYRIIQVYYDDQTLRNCYKHPSVKKLYNPTHTDFFENTIISLAKCEADDFDFYGVWSHAHKFKVQGQKLVFEKLEDMMSRFDVIAFQRMLSNGRIFSGEVEKMYKEKFNSVMEALKLKYRFPARPKFVVMQNHFICRGEIFTDYVKRVLDPAMTLIDEIGGIEIEYRGKAKRYTLKPFLCEKLMSAYLEEKKFKCVHW